MENLSVDLKASQPLLIATDGTRSVGTTSQENEKKKESFDRAPFAQAIAFVTPQSPNPSRRNINPFHDAIIEHKRVVKCRSTPESLGCREKGKRKSSHPVCSLLERGAPNCRTRRIESKGPFRHAKKSKTKAG